MQIHFGCFADPINTQLSAIGMSDTKAELHDRISECLSMLHIHGYIADSVCDKAYNRLAKDIERHAVKMED